MKKQNVIYIHTHDSGQIFSPYGYQVPTPELKAFADDATVFTNAFCASSTCSPSRSALVTGQFPHRNGMLGLANRGFTLSDYQSHMVNYFNHNGYHTVLCGIQHEYGRYTDHTGGARQIGYQQDISTDCSGFCEKEMVQWDQNNTESFVNWLNTYESDKPFFLSFGFFSTHREYPDPSPLAGEEASAFPEILEDIPEVREDFKGHVESLRLFDKNFGTLISALKETGIYDDTIILFTTDHGIPFPRAKCTLYDAGIRIALIMRVPDTPHGQCADGLVSHVDVLPTLYGLLNLEGSHDFDGIDLTPMFYDSSRKLRDDIFAEVNFHTSYEPIRCIRTEQFKYIRYYDDSYLISNLSNIDNSIAKNAYLENRMLPHEKAPEQFYVLTDDPLERQNKIHDPTYEADIQMLKERLAALMESTHDPLLNGPIPIQESWIVNTSQCTDPKSKAAVDFLSSDKDHHR